MTDALQEMLSQLESHRLEVMLVPLSPRLRNYNDGGMKRVVADKPPKFYRDLCNRYPSSRGVRRGKFDTKIKRQAILRILTRLSSGQPSRSKYAPDLIQIAKFFCAQQSGKILRVA